MELSDPPGEFKPVIDRRPLVPEPLPVRLIAIDDVHLPSAAGREVELDGFYVTLLGFEREATAGEEVIVYRAENFRVRFTVLEPPIQREELRPTGIEVQDLIAIEHQLVEQQIDYTRQRGLAAGEDGLVLRDPAGNWVNLIQLKPF